MVSNIHSGKNDLVFNFTIAVWLKAPKNDTIRAVMGPSFMVNTVIIGCFGAKLQSVFMI